MVSSVLIVDDDPGFRALAARILGGMGIEVVASAPDVASAIAAAEAKRPEAMLVDVGLPDRDGIDLAYELAALPWAPRIVVTSTDADAGRAIVPAGGQEKLPFVPKEELTDGFLRRMLMAE
jgi:DNA-binding NarL/FixJ family response regulator